MTQLFKYQFSWLLFLQFVVFVLAGLGHAPYCWKLESKTAFGRPRGGLWQLCDLSESGCSYLDESNVDDTDWILINSARATLLASHLFAVIEMLACVLAISGAVKSLVPHAITIFIQWALVASSVVLMTYTFDVLKDRQFFNYSWGLFCPTVGMFTLIPMFFVSLGRCEQGTGLEDEEDEDKQPLTT